MKDDGATPGDGRVEDRTGPDAPARPVPPDRPADPAGERRAAAQRRSSWRTIARVLGLRATRAQLLAGLLSALLGFALVVQVQANRTEGLASLRTDELVRILDEVSQRSQELEVQVGELRAQRAELLTGSDTERAAREAAAERAEVEGILAGRLPAQGPGVELLLREPEGRLPAFVLVTVLEELRNAGAEAVQLNDQRLTASSYIIDTPRGVEVDGTALQAPYRWVAIGDPDTISAALNIPGGALASVRREGGTADLQTREQVEVTAVRLVDPPRWATPVPAPEPQ